MSRYRSRMGNDRKARREIGRRLRKGGVMMCMMITSAMLLSACSGGNSSSKNTTAAQTTEAAAEGGVKDSQNELMGRVKLVSDTEITVEQGPGGAPGRTDRDSVVPPRSGSERRYGGLRSGDVACRGAFRGAGRDALHLRRYFPARRARVQGAAARAVRHRSRRTALGRIFSGGDGGFPRVGVENGGRDDDGRRIGACRRRACRRSRFRGVTARRNRSQRRERRVPHFLLRRADLRFARAVPARNAFQPQLRRPARRRDVEELRLLVRRSAGGVIPLFAAGRNTGLCISVSSSAIGFVRCVFRSERRAVVATALSLVVGREHPASFSCSFR